MQAIILTAGFGRRMRPLTDTIHKTLLPVGDRTILEWIVDGLAAQRISRITVVTGYRAAEVRAFLMARYPDQPITYIHNPRFAQTNNIYSLALALNQTAIDDDVLLIESDLVFDPKVLTRIMASQHENVALVDHYRPGMDGTVVEVVDGVVRSVIPPHLQGAQFDFSDKYKTLNIYRFSQAFCAGPFKKLLTYYADVIDDNAFYELALGILIYVGRAVIHAEVLDGERWAEIDDPNDLAVAQFEFDTAARRRLLQQTHGGYWNYDLLDFAYLRNMYFPTHAVLAELRNSLPALVQNYGSAQAVLDRKLAYFLNCDPTRLTVLNGASQAFPPLRSRLAGQRLLIPAPTFGEYSRLFPDAACYRDQVGIDPAEVEARSAACDGIVLVNPNNPTGSLLPSGWIYDLAARHPAKTVIVDESFIEFSEQPSLLPQLESDPLPNVILLKSLSKTLGAPGLRLGYLYTADRALRGQMLATLPVWNLNSLAEHFLEIILKHRPAIEASYRQTQQDRTAFAGQLAQLRSVAQVYPSGGNFLLIALRCRPTDLPALADRLLQRHRIYVKSVAERFTNAAALVRVAVRLPAENARLAAALAEEASILTTPYPRLGSVSDRAPARSESGQSGFVKVCE